MAKKQPSSTQLYGEKISLLMKALDFNQTELSRRTNVSRVSLNRFLCGQTEIRLSDFIAILNELGINMEQVLESQIALASSGVKAPKVGLGLEVSHILQRMPLLGRKSYLYYLAAHATAFGIHVSRKSIERLGLIKK